MSRLICVYLKSSLFFWRFVLTPIFFFFLPYFLSLPHPQYPSLSYIKEHKYDASRCQEGSSFLSPSVWNCKKLDGKLLHVGCQRGVFSIICICQMKMSGLQGPFPKENMLFAPNNIVSTSTTDQLYSYYVWEIGFSGAEMLPLRPLRLHDAIATIRTLFFLVPLKTKQERQASFLTQIQADQDWFALQRHTGSTSSNLHWLGRV